MESKPRRNKDGEPSSKNEFRPVMLKPNKSTIKFLQKHPMEPAEFVFPPPMSDEEKLLAEGIKS